MENESARTNPDRKWGLVDEVEVYRSFGGCLPAESTAANSIFKTLGQLNAQKDGDAKTKEDWIHEV